MVVCPRCKEDTERGGLVVELVAVRGEYYLEGTVICVKNNYYA